MIIATIRIVIIIVEKHFRMATTMVVGRKLKKAKTFHTISIVAFCAFSRARFTIKFIASRTLIYSNESSLIICLWAKIAHPKTTFLMADSNGLVTCPVGTYLSIIVSHVIPAHESTANLLDRDFIAWHTNSVFTITHNDLNDILIKRWVIYQSIHEFC